jgi:hypothetical protein
LNAVERRLSQVEVANENGDEHREVDSNLELKETFDVGVDVAAPHDGAEAALKVVGSEDHGGVRSGEGGSAHHGERHVGSLEGSNVVETITNDGDLLTLVLETGSDEELVLRVSSSENLESVHDLVELLLVVGSIDDVTIFILGLANSTNLLAEVSSVHAVKTLLLSRLCVDVLGENASLDSNSLGGVE